MYVQTEQATQAPAGFWEGGQGSCFPRSEASTGSRLSTSFERQVRIYIQYA